MVKQIEDWKYVLLDTGVIIDYLTLPERITKNENHKKRVEKTHKLFKYFSDASNESKRVLFITAITLAELRKNIGDDTLLKNIVSLFNTSDVTFIDFTKEMAMQIHSHMNLFDKEPHLNSFLADLTQELNKEQVYQASGWVSDDLKIVATAKFFKGKIDAVLTGDGKTFLPVAKRFEIPVIYTFNLPEDIFGEIDVRKEFP